MAEDKLYRVALREALAEEMERDDSVYLIGEDIGKFGGAYRVTDGLLDKFGAERVVDAPIAEEVIVGTAIGSMLGGGWGGGYGDGGGFGGGDSGGGVGGGFGGDSGDAGGGWDFGGGDFGGGGGGDF